MSELIFDPAKTCCFTGHRPDGIIERPEDLEYEFDTALRQACLDGYTTFLTGMAKGFDIIAAEYVLLLRQSGSPVRLVCAMPYPAFGARGKDEWSERSRRILGQADDIVYVCDHYHRGVFQQRNRWMVDRSSRVIAYYKGTDGGTKNTVEYAAKRNRTVINLFDFAF